MGRGRRPRRAEYGRVAGCSPRSAPCRAGEARAFVQALRRTCAAGAPRAHLRRRRGDRGSRQGRAPQKRYHPHPPVPRQSPRLRVPREGSRAASVYWGCFKITAAQALTASSLSVPPPPRRNGAGSSEHTCRLAPGYLPRAVWKGGRPCRVNGGKGDFLNFAECKAGASDCWELCGKGKFSLFPTCHPHLHPQEKGKKNPLL